MSTVFDSATPNSKEFTQRVIHAVNELTTSLNREYQPVNEKCCFSTIQLAVGCFSQLSLDAQKSLRDFYNKLQAIETKNTDAEKFQLVKGIFADIGNFQTQSPPLDFASMADDAPFTCGLPDLSQHIMESFEVVENQTDDSDDLNYKEKQVVESALFFIRTATHYFPEFLNGFSDEHREIFFQSIHNAVRKNIFQDSRNSTIQERKIVLTLIDAVATFLLDFSNGNISLKNIDEESTDLSDALKEYLCSLIKSYPDLAIIFAFLLNNQFSSYLVEQIKSYLTPYAFCIIINELVLKTPQFNVPDRSSYPFGLYDSKDEEFNKAMNKIYSEKLKIAVVKLGKGENLIAINSLLKYVQNIVGQYLQKGLNKIKNSGSSIMPIELANTILFQRNGDEWSPKLIFLKEEDALRAQVNEDLQKRLMKLIKELIEGTSDKKKSQSYWQKGCRKAASGVVSITAWTIDADKFAKNISGELFKITQDQRYILRLIQYFLIHLAKVDL
ncbi:MAG: hypothetical protein H7A37_05250 [Chlamydiales bacterium]|nr:hypothetical protein [Chlamydiia bacterium]MCP5507686.1 hypothetical protein [Chlamydiales bacterium]